MIAGFEQPPERKANRQRGGDKSWTRIDLIEAETKIPGGGKGEIEGKFFCYLRFEFWYRDYVRTCVGGFDFVMGSERSRESRR